MTLKDRILLQSLKWVFLLFFGIGALVYTIFLAIYVIQPNKSFLNADKITVWGYDDTWKGIPIIVEPDSIGTNQNGERIPFFGKDRPVAFYDSIRSHGWTGEAISKKNSFGLSGTGAIQLRMRPDDAGNRIQLSIPEILKWLFFGILSLFVYRMCKDILKRRLTFKQISGIVILSGCGALAYQLVMLFLKSSQAFGNEYYVRITSQDPNFKEPLIFHGHPVNPFSLLYLILGIVGILSGFLLRKTKFPVPKHNFSESLEKMAEA